MSKFKIGDRVIVTDTDYISANLQNGQTGEIVSGNRHCWGVRMDTGKRDDPTGEGWGFYESQIDLLGAWRLRRE